MHLFFACHTSFAQKFLFNGAGFCLGMRLRMENRIFTFLIYYLSLRVDLFASFQVAPPVRKQPVYRMPYKNASPEGKYSEVQIRDSHRRFGVSAIYSAEVNENTMHA